MDNNDVTKGRFLPGGRGPGRVGTGRVFYQGELALAAFSTKGKG